MNIGITQEFISLPKLARNKKNKKNLIIASTIQRWGSVCLYLGVPCSSGVLMGGEKENCFCFPEERNYFETPNAKMRKTHHISLEKDWITKKNISSIQRDELIFSVLFFLPSDLFIRRCSPAHVRSRETRWKLTPENSKRSCIFCWESFRKHCVDGETGKLFYFHLTHKLRRKL